jgi:hypothetical protein
VDVLAVLIVLAVIAVYAVLDALEDDPGEELDPLDLARPSVERLEAEARRAAEELQALDRQGRQ